MSSREQRLSMFESNIWSKLFSSIINRHHHDHHRHRHDHDHHAAAKTPSSLSTAAARPHQTSCVQVWRFNQSPKSQSLHQDVAKMSFICIFPCLIWSVAILYLGQKMVKRSTSVETYNRHLVALRGLQRIKRLLHTFAFLHRWHLVCPYIDIRSSC